MQRNGQNPIRAVKFGGNQSIKVNEGVILQGKDDGGGMCPKCKTDIPAKHGFRFSSLKCPKCGSQAIKK